MRKLQADKQYLLSPDYLKVGVIDGVSSSEMTSILETVKKSVTPKGDSPMKPIPQPEPTVSEPPKEQLPSIVKEFKKKELPPQLEQVPESVFSSPMNITTPLNKPSDSESFEPFTSKRRPDIELNLEEQQS